MEVVENIKEKIYSEPEVYRRADGKTPTYNIVSIQTIQNAYDSHRFGLGVKARLAIKPQ